MQRALLTSLLVALSCLLADAASAYPADITVEAGELKLDARLHTDGHFAIVQVSNLDEVTIRCEAEFTSGPERGRARRAIIAPGDSAALRWKYQSTSPDSVTQPFSTFTLTFPTGTLTSHPRLCTARVAISSSE